jgi:replication factor C subunit 1
MDFKDKYISWTSLTKLSLHQIKQNIKFVGGKHDFLVNHKPDYLIVGSDELNSWRYKKLSSSTKTTIIEEDDFIIFVSNMKPKQLLSDCLKPKKISDVIGHPTTIESLKNWLVCEKRDLNGVLLTGPPGIGKTTIAHLIPKKLGFNVEEFNASDARSASAIKELFSNCKKTHALQKLCIVMDEIDGMSSGDKGGIVELANIIKTSSIPFICIANERSSKKIKPILNVTLDLKMNRPNKTSIATSLKKKLDVSGYSYSVEELESLCEKNGNDIRSILNNIEFNSKSNKDQNHLLDPFSATYKLFNNKTDLQTKEMSVYFDFSLVPLMAYEIYPSTVKDSKKSLEELWKASDSLSTFDLFDSRIHRKQEWELMPSAVQSVVQTASIASGPTPYQMFPTYLGKMSKRNKHKRELNEISNYIGTTTNNLVLESIDLLNYKLFEPLKNPSNIPLVIKDLDSLHLTRDHLFETLNECSFVDYSKYIDTKTKTAFTREYNKTYSKSVGKDDVAYVGSESDSDD